MSIENNLIIPKISKLCINFFALFIMIIPQDVFSKLPYNTFKGVTDCFRHDREYNSPTLGMAALDGGLVDNLRFFGNFTAAYQKNPQTGIFTHERDFANDSSRDPVWRMIRFFFPSTAGQISGESRHYLNLGKYIHNPKTMALFLNYANVIRHGENRTKNEKMKELKEKIKNSILTEEILKSPEIVKYNLEIEEKIASAKLNNLETSKQVNKIIDQLEIEQHPQEELKKVVLEEVKKRLEEIRTINTSAIMELFEKDINKTLRENNKNKLSWDDFLNFVKKHMKSSSDNYFNITKLQEMEKNKFEFIFMAQTLNPLLNFINTVINTEKNEDAQNKSIYPLYTPEQIITAFFCYKFDERKDIKEFLEGLDVSIIDPDKVSQFNSQALLNRDELDEIALKDTYNLDDIFALTTSDLWTSLTPYREGSELLSNGNALYYDRKMDNYLRDKGYFADCGEIAMRHLINFIIYDPENRSFDLNSIRQYVNEKNDNPYFQNFIEFYKVQKPDLANNGSLQIRSLWNKVVGDLNTNLDDPFRVNYAQQNNELETGFVNLIKVFKKIFNLQIDPFPTDTLQVKKIWLEKSFQTLFMALNPNRSYQLNLDEVQEDKTNKNEISGIIQITVLEKDPLTQQNIPLFILEFSSDFGKHSEVEKFEIIKKDPKIEAQIEEFSRLLMTEEKTNIKRKSAEEAIWFLTTNMTLKNEKYENYPQLYQLFDRPISDFTDQIRWLQTLNLNYDYFNNLFTLDTFRGMLKNIIAQLDLSDQHTLKNAAETLYRLIIRSEWTMKELKNSYNEALKSVQIGGDYSDLDNSSLNVVLNALEVNNPTLMTLELQPSERHRRTLHQKKISDEDAAALSKALQHNTHLTTLILKSNKIGHRGASAIADALKQNAHLKILKISDDMIGNRGASAIADALKHNNSLEKLDMTSNDIGAEGAISIAEMLKINKTLKILNWKRNRIHTAGMKAFAEALKKNNTLEILSLKDCEITPEGAKYLSRGLIINKHLKELNLINNKLETQGIIALMRGLHTNRTLLSLNLSENKLETQEIEAIADLLKKNITLTSLSLRGIQFNEKRVKILAEALKSNETLQILDIGNNTQMGNDRIAAIKEASQNNTHLKIIWK